MYVVFEYENEHIFGAVARELRESTCSVGEHGVVTVKEFVVQRSADVCAVGVVC